MLTYSLAPNTLRRASSAETGPRECSHAWARQSSLLRIDTGFGARKPTNEDRTSRLLSVGDEDRDALKSASAHIVTRRAIGWEGISAEIVPCLTHDHVEFQCYARFHSSIGALSNRRLVCWMGDTRCTVQR
jgi:AraC family transcriptional regulator